MSFLSSHRLHWGVHHELSDNFWVHLQEMVQGPANSAHLSAGNPDTGSPSEGITHTGGLSEPVAPSPEALGP
ncbi:hypothetical protein [Rariglobus hedericola]|uniref:Uncharacterized protein n=1 Tax=Rariglobus hedericola TaxID=2597822 RepID=A0A556QQF5_9BACT|nr:hypothetical protein [Rariglobus hedericola]TSJ78861.1 hypothetical protein FPL22_06035 [Rariglobus hedericola]